MTRCSAHYRQIDVSRFVSRRSKTFFFSFFFAILSKKIWNEEYKPENKNTPLQLEKNFPKIWSTKLSSFFFVIRLIKKKNRQIDHTIHKKSSSRKKLRHKIPSIPSLPKKKTIEPISQTRFSIPLKKKKKKKKKERKKSNDTDFRVAPKSPIHSLYLNILSTPSATRKLDSVQ